MQQTQKPKPAPRSRMTASRPARNRRSAEQMLAELRHRLHEISDLNAAGDVLNWDQATYMLNGGAGARGLQLATLHRLAHERAGLYVPEIHRLRGVFLKSLGSPAVEVERTLRTALEIADEQGAFLLKLRAAMSLARLWRDQGKVQQARELLAPVYGWFTEGFDTRDLKEAKTLLDELHA